MITVSSRQKKKRRSPALWVALSAICALVLLSAGPARLAADDDAAQAGARIVNLFNLRIDNPAVTVRVVPLPDGKFAVALSGTLPAGDLEAVKNRANAIKASTASVTDLVLKDLKREPDVQPAPTPEKIVTALWSLTFIRSTVHPTGTDTAVNGTTARDSIDDLVTALNVTYAPRKDRELVKRATLRQLLIRGTEKEVLAIRRLLARLDVPWPQVQLTLWAVR